MVALRDVSYVKPSSSELKDFLCTRYWLPLVDYPLCGDIFDALGMTGSDCHDFMENFAVAFNVDLSDYIWPKYHLSESEAQDVRAVLRPLMRFAGLKTKPLNRDLVPISIDHLLQVAEHGRWIDPAGRNADGEGRVGLSRNLTRFGAKLRAGGVPKTRGR